VTGHLLCKLCLQSLPSKQGLQVIVCRINIFIDTMTCLRRKGRLKTLLARIPIYNSKWVMELNIYKTTEWNCTLRLSVLGLGRTIVGSLSSPTAIHGKLALYISFKIKNLIFLVKFHIYCIYMVYMPTILWLQYNHMPHVRSPILLPDRSRQSASSSGHVPL
jgi:hypothetical protein